MLSESDARARAEAALHELSSDDRYVIVDVQALEVGWLFFWDSKQHQDTRALDDALAGNAPLLVDRHDGTVHFTGTALPVADYVTRYVEARRRRDEGWPEKLSDRLRTLLTLVEHGQGNRDTRALELLINRRHAPSSHTVLDELVEMERRGLITREPDNRWKLTAEGRYSLAKVA